MVTEFGLCCSFNLLPDVKDKTKNTNDVTWRVEGGYKNSPSKQMTKNPHLQEKPYRTDIAGLPGGLSFSLDLQVDFNFTLSRLLHGQDDNKRKVMHKLKTVAYFKVLYTFCRQTSTFVLSICPLVSRSWFILPFRSRR